MRQLAIVVLSMLTSTAMVGCIRASGFEADIAIPLAFVSGVLWVLELLVLLAIFPAKKRRTPAQDYRTHVSALGLHCGRCGFDQAIGPGFWLEDAERRGWRFTHPGDAPVYPFPLCPDCTSLEV